MKIQSDFAILDVKRGRVALLKACNKIDPEGIYCTIPVTITGYITGPWGNDDGTSREFVVQVECAEVE